MLGFPMMKPRPWLSKEKTGPWGMIELLFLQPHPHRVYALLAVSLEVSSSVTILGVLHTNKETAEVRVVSKVFDLWACFKNVELGNARIQPRRHCNTCAHINAKVTN